jgi:hypothetical protein
MSVTCHVPPEPFFSVDVASNEAYNLYSERIKSNEWDFLGYSQTPSNECGDKWMCLRIDKACLNPWDQSDNLCGVIQTNLNWLLVQLKGTSSDTVLRSGTDLPVRV